MKPLPKNSKPRFVHTMSVVVAGVLFFTGCGQKQEHGRKTSSPQLPTAVVRVQAVESSVQQVTEEVVGTVRARRNATVEAKVSGRIETLPVIVGKRVKAGELIATLQVAEINARLEQAEAALEQAEREWKRNSALFEQQSATRAEFDAAQSRRRMAQGAVSEARAMMSYASVVAPFDGVVSRKWAEVGDLAAPGKPIVSIEDPSAFQLEANVPQSIAAFVKLGAKLAVRVDGVGDQMTGVVSELAPAADSASRTAQVKVDLPADACLGSGRFARLIVPVGETPSLRVPAAAVIQRGQLDIVFVVAGQRAQLHLVKTGKRTGNEFEILSGLQAGDSVVIDGAAQLMDGQPVEVK